MSGRTGPRKGPSQPVSDLLPGLLDDLGMGEASLGMRILRVWDEVLGPQLAPHCRPDGLRNGELHALVTDSSWMQRIQLEKPGILARLREQLGDQTPTGLRLRIGRSDAAAR